MSNGYLHGHNKKERKRLTEQAGFLESMIYEYLDLSQHKHMLEMGCGTGGQSKIILSNYEDIKLESFDISPTQINEAKSLFSGFENLRERVNFSVQDATKTTFANESFDGVFIVWVLEHSPRPDLILEEAYRVLKPNGKIYLTEVYNQSLNLSPESPFQIKYYDKYNELQRKMGGDPNIGLKLGNLLHEIGFSQIYTRNLRRHFDKRNIQDRNTMFDYWKELLLSAKENLLEAGMIDETFLEKTLKEIQQLKDSRDAIFYYSPIQAEAVKLS